MRASSLPRLAVETQVLSFSRHDVSGWIVRTSVVAWSHTLRVHDSRILSFPALEDSIMMINLGCDLLMTFLSRMEKLSPTALFQHQLKHEIAFLKTKSPNAKSFKCFNVCALCTCFICVCFHKKKHTHTQAEVASGSMKRSVSTIADQRVNGLWEEEEKSPERIYRPRHKSYKAAGLCCLSSLLQMFMVSSNTKSDDTGHFRYPNDDSAFGVCVCVSQCLAFSVPV